MMLPDSLPPELNRRWGHLKFIKQRDPHEWSAECPKCGDSGHGGSGFPDRFRMFDDKGKPRGWCRRCGYQAFADDDHKEFVVTEELKRQWLQERIERELKEKERIAHALELLRKENSYLHYHELIDQFGYAEWHRKGVPDHMINRLMLGYCPSKTIWSDGAEFETPTLTIPVFAPGWQLMNIRHRLLQPRDPNDKYRPDRSGLPVSLYLTDPDDEPHNEVILVEGEIKSIVIYDRLDSAKLQVAAIPGKTPNLAILEPLKQAGRVWIVLDPDADLQAVKIAHEIGKAARIVRMNCKPDDFFTLYHGTAHDFYSALKWGRVIT